MSETISEKLNRLIAEQNGSARDALNVVLAKLDIAESKIDSLESVDNLSNNVLLDSEVYLALTRYANQSNWECKKEYGPYGSFYIYTWTDGDDPWNIAQEILDKYNEAEDV